MKCDYCWNGYRLRQFWKPENWKWDYRRRWFFFETCRECNGYGKFLK